MPNRVNVDVHVRDLTRPELARMRRGFSNLGRDLDRAVGTRTRQNFERLSQSVSQARRDLTALRGAIPEDDFLRMDDAIRRAQRRMQRGFGRVGARAMREIATDVREVAQAFEDLDRSASIRIRVDEAALRRMARERERMAREAEREARRRSQAAEQAARDARDYRRRWVRAFLGRPLRIPTEPDGTFWQRRVRSMSRLLTSPFRLIAGTIGGILQDGIGQGIVNGIKSAGPVVGTAFAAILVAAVVGAAGVIGAALSGLLVTALGAAFLGIGIVSAATSDEVQRNWKTAVANMKADFKSVGEPLVPLVHETVHDLEHLVDRVAPKLKTAFEDAVPATREFKDSLLEGLESLGKEMFQPIMDAWRVFAPVFGEQWEEFMTELGQSFADMARLVQEHPQEIAAALEVVFEALELLVDTVTFLGKVWVFTLRTVVESYGALLTVIADVTDFAIGAVGEIIHAFAILTSAIPGVGDKMKDAEAAFNTWAGTATEDLRRAGSEASAFGERLDEANRERQLHADIEVWKHKLELARADLKKTTDQKAKAKLDADINALEAKIKAARKQLSDLNNSSATSYVYTVYQDIYTTLDKRQKRHGLAHGGVRGLSAAATGGARNNMTLVGEQGPEIVNLAPGSRVRSNSDTRRILRQGDQEGGAGFTLEINSSGSRVDDLIVEVLRRAVKARGGNVQFGVMGRG